MAHTDRPGAEFASLMDLASSRLGGRAIAANDEFFAEKENLLKPEAPVFIAGRFTDRGKWMDGWESRRRREPGNDWCVIALGVPGIIHGFNIDTAHFNGNQPESCTIEAAELPADPSIAELSGPSIPWTTVLDRTTLRPSSEHLVPAASSAGGRRFTHLRLNIFPDGGVARLRVYGEATPDWNRIVAAGRPIDLAAAEHGGLVVAANDMHFGSRHNLIMPGRAANMGDGWETRRKRGLKGGEHDWAIVRLGHRGVISEVEVDTNHFKGNFPESCLLEVCDQADAIVPSAAAAWKTLLDRTRLRADTQHLFERELASTGPCSHARLKIFPDGGVSRLRIWGVPA